MIKDRVGLPMAVSFIESKIKEFDMSGVKYISLNEKSNHQIIHGRCTYPTKREKLYKIRAAVNPHINYPATHTHWGRIADDDYKQGWRSGEAKFIFNDVNEAAVHVLAHEIAHYLLRVKQIKEKNVEANCNMIADQWLGEYKLKNQ